MTGGLIVSRRTKNTLHKAVITNPSELNINYYKTYRNIYNKILRKSKALYFETELKNSKAKLKKTWDVLCEAMNTNSVDTSIPEIHDKNLTVF